MLVTTVLDIAVGPLNNENRVKNYILESLRAWSKVTATLTLNRLSK